MGGKDTKGADTKAAFSRESGSTSAFQFCVYYTVKKTGAITVGNRLKF